MLKPIVNKPKRLIGVALSFSLAVTAGAAISLYEMRVDAFERAREAASNMTEVIEYDVTRNLDLYSAALETVAQRLADPEVATLSDHVRRMALFGGMIRAEDLGSILVSDRQGQAILDSRAEPPRPLHFGDRDYFLVHARGQAKGLYVSKPFQVRTGFGPAIALSLGLKDAGGQFAGVVVGGLRLSYFDRLFARMSLGTHGTVALLYADGSVVARRPAIPLDSPAATRSVQADMLARNPQGIYLGRSVRDGVERLYVYRRIGAYPLFVAVGAATGDIYASWKARAWAIGVLGVLFNLATLATACLFARQLEGRLAEQRRHAELAATDGLTGLANRRALDERLAQETRRAARGQHSIAVLMVDVDHFKAYNDHYGHLRGDSALRAVAECVRANVRRPGDLAARYGGEEFCVVLPDIDLASAGVVAENIRRAIQALALPHARSPAGMLTVSIGGAAGTPRPGDDTYMEALAAEADAQLYRAKALGRNRCMPQPATAEAGAPPCVPVAPPEG